MYIERLVVELFSHVQSDRVRHSFLPAGQKVCKKNTLPCLLKVRDRGRERRDKNTRGEQITCSLMHEWKSKTEQNFMSLNKDDVKLKRNILCACGK